MHPLEFNWWFLAYVFGSLGLFIYGLKIMSDGIQRAAGPQMKLVLKKMTSNKLVGISTGFIVTSIIQSSSAATVFTVGFVNAGLVTLAQSVGVIMGINIGTTITGWIISVLELQIGSYKTVLPLMILILPLFLSKKKVMNAWGDFLMGFMLLVIGLLLMKENVPDYSMLGEQLSFLQSWASSGYISIFIFLLVGVFLTIILQSSTATMALTIVLCNAGWFSLEPAAAMILGANVGTTFTAEFAALIANVHAKRCARVHTIFNMAGVVWMIPVMPLFLNLVDFTGMKLFYEQSAFINSGNIPLALSIFHSGFNIFNTILLVGFTGKLIALAEKTVRVKTIPKEIVDLNIGSASPITDFPEIGLLSIQNKLINLIKDTKKISLNVKNLLTEADHNNKTAIQEVIRIQINNKLQEMNLAKLETDSIIVSQLSITSKNLLKAFKETLSDLNSIISNYEKILDIIDYKNNHQIWFNPKQRLSLINCFKNIEAVYTILSSILSKGNLSESEFSNGINSINLAKQQLFAESVNSEQGESHKLGNEIYISISDHLKDITQYIESTFQRLHSTK